MTPQTRRNMGRIALLVILLVLCYRATINEGIDDGFIGTLSTQLSGLPVAVEIACAAALVLLCSGVGLLVETPQRWPMWGTLAIITGLSAAAFADAIPAANHFAALIGACDFSMNLLAGWTVALLCNSPNRRAFALSVLASLGAVLAFKGLIQHFVELPQTMAEFSRHPDRWLAHLGIRPGSPAVKLFISRLKSHEVTGFGADNDQFGEALIPLILLNLMLVWSTYYWVKISTRATGTELQPKAKRNSEKATTTAGGDINMLVIGTFFAVVVSLAELAVLWFTRSKGSIAATVLCTAVLVGGLAAAQYVERLRYWLFWMMVVLAMAGVGILIAWGLAFHGLPTKDLLFRWQYWNGAVGIILHHAWHGVGLNNFGYYYTRYKWPSAPEDVKDPHNVLVRVAAELGGPAVIAFIILLGMAFYGVFRPARENVRPHATPPMLLIIGFALLWWLGVGLSRSIGAGKATAYVLEMSALYAAITIVTMAVVCQHLTYFSGNYRRKIEIALAVGAGGMLLYDQINLALVTGYVAMLFWIILAIAQPLDELPANAAQLPSGMARAGQADPQLSKSRGDGLAPAANFSGSLPPQGNSKLKNATARLCGAVFLASSLALVGGAITPMVSGHFAWDTRATAAAYEHNMAYGHLHRALADINYILAYDRRSPAWLERKISVLEELGQNPRAVTLRLLHLNTADARVRIPLAMTPASGLTLPERIAQLKLAIKLNRALPKTETTRISPKHIAALRAMIENLQSQLPAKVRP